MECRVEQRRRQDMAAPCRPCDFRDAQRADRLLAADPDLLDAAIVRTVRVSPLQAPAVEGRTIDTRRASAADGLERHDLAARRWGLRRQFASYMHDWRGPSVSRLNRKAIALRQ